MFRRRGEEDGSNFWISYADLTAGLLFVFILLIGAIITKSIVLKSDLHTKQERLAQLSLKLDEKEKRLAALENQVKTQQKSLQEASRIIDEKRRRIEEQTQTIRLQKDEIAKLNALLKAANLRETELTQRMAVLTEKLAKLNTTLQYERNQTRSRLVVLSDTVTELNATLAQKDKEILKLLNALDERQTRYDALIAKLQRQRARIKALTGIRLKVIAALKARLGDKLTVDKGSGALRLASSILFDKGSAELKEEAKAALRESFEEYVRTLLEDPAVAPHLDKIVIEGHTDSDGGFLYNLELSQKRALSVMHYLSGLDVTRRYNLEPMLEASGRAYLDAVRNPDGTENKDASRRIEIKFRLKNKEAMEEIERILDAR
jgi:chemotaxis protein MotB